MNIAEDVRADVDKYFVLDFYSAKSGGGMSGGHIGGGRARGRGSTLGGEGEDWAEQKTKLVTLLFLTMLGVFATSVAYMANVGIYYWVEVRTSSVKALSTASPLLGHVLFVVLSTLSGLAAAIIVKYGSLAAAGSGIPEMKSHLSGVVHAHFLTTRTFVSKLFGIVAAQAAGLSVGKEGPFVHLAAGTASILFRNVPWFHTLYENGPLRIQLLAAAVAVGVTATFGAPIGACLFSIEVTATYYFVSNLPMAYYAAVVGIFFVRLLAEIPGIDVYNNLALFETDIHQLPYSFVEFLAYAFVGLCCGLMGSLFILAVAKLIYLRARIPWLGVAYPLTSVVVVTFVSASITRFLNQLLHEDEQTNIEVLVSHEEITSLNTIIIDLLIYIPIKFFLTTIAVVLPIPSGVFSPVFAAGAAFGRLVGEIMAHSFPSLHVAAGGYAIVGAAAMTAGVTRTISTAIIAVELTGQTHHLVPSFMAVLLAYSVGNLITPPFYEVLLSIKAIPFLPKVRARDLTKPVASIMRMRDSLQFLTVSSTYADVLHVLRGNDYMGLPWVDSAESDVFLGVVSRASLEEQLERFLEEEVLDEEGNVLPSFRGTGNGGAGEYLPPVLGDVFPSASESASLSSASSSGYEEEEEDWEDDGGGLRGGRSSTFHSRRSSSFSAANDHYVALRDERDAMEDVSLNGESSLRNRAVTMGTTTRAGARGVVISHERPVYASAARTEQIESMITPSVHTVLANTVFPFAHPGIVIDDAPFTLAPSTSLSRVDFLFRMAGISHVWITWRGTLQGCVTKKDLIRFASA